jgi:outer membrane protein TolC
MCGPALPLLAAGLAVARTGIGTISAMHQAQAQREAALQQAEQERAAARDAQDETARALADQYRAMAATEGASAWPPPPAGSASISAPRARPSTAPA